MAHCSIGSLWFQLVKWDLDCEQHADAVEERGGALVGGAGVRFAECHFDLVIGVVTQFCELIKLSAPLSFNLSRSNDTLSKYDNHAAMSIRINFIKQAVQLWRRERRRNTRVKSSPHSSLCFRMWQPPLNFRELVAILLSLGRDS